MLLYTSAIFKKIKIQKFYILKINFGPPHELKKTNFIMPRPAPKTNFFNFFSSHNHSTNFGEQNDTLRTAENFFQKLKQIRSEKSSLFEFSSKNTYFRIQIRLFVPNIRLFAYKYVYLFQIYVYVHTNTYICSKLF